MNMNAGNCNYAVELGRQCKFSLVGIDGKDIYDGKDVPTNGQHVPTLGTANWSTAFLRRFHFCCLLITHAGCTAAGVGRASVESVYLSAL